MKLLIKITPYIIFGILFIFLLNNYPLNHFFIVMSLFISYGISIWILQKELNSNES